MVLLHPVLSGTCLASDSVSLEVSSTLLRPKSGKDEGSLAFPVSEYQVSKNKSLQKALVTDRCLELHPAQVEYRPGDPYPGW